MTDPSKETISAALRLAEAAADYEDKPCQENWHEYERNLSAYRATLPKPLRTRAERDREVAQLMFDCECTDGSGWYIDSSVKARLWHLKHEVCK